MKRRLLLFTVLFFCSQLCFGTTFTVTSNADAGPGTLREALTNAAANGISTQDIIQFALPGTLVSDRIIRLKTQLPYVTSNLIIDGTTQTGAVFGVSDAKVVIEPETSPAYFSALNINGDVYNSGTVANAIEIYGLYIRNFARITNVANPDMGQGSGIYITGEASAITIGAPGKGNVICGNIFGVVNNNYYSYTGINDIKLQSNIIGLLDDGFTANTNMYGISLSIDQNLIIGGPNANMGNVVSANVNNINLTRSYYLGTPTAGITIQNNKIGTNYAGTADYKNIALFQLSAFIQTFGININGAGIAKITYNLISGQRYCGVYIESTTFEIEGNKIGTNIAGTADLGNGEGIRIGTNASGNVGGNDASAANIIAYNSYGIEALNNAHALISRNSMFCNKEYGISVTTGFYAVPFVKVLGFSTTKVSGVATPNSKIELFAADACGFVNCQGKTYITTVNSNANGEWSYSGTITNAVIATATDGNNNTSAFSSLEIADADIEVKQLTCAYNGSITIKPAYAGLLFHWDKKEQNGALTDKGDTKNLTNLQPGIYQLTVQYPGGCQKSTKLFDIKDQRIKIQNIIPPTPECRQKFFPVDVNYQGGTGNVTFTWKNAAGEVKSTNKQGIIPGGTYTLTIADDAGCSVTSAAFIITPKPGPDYDESTATRTPARCGEKNGAVTGVTYYQGIGPITYTWRNQAGTVVGHNKDLTDVVSGLYTLEVADQSQCSPYTKPNVIFYVPEVNSITISTGNIIPITCNNANGAITNVQVSSNVDEVQWYDANSNPIPTTLANYQNLYNLTAGTYRLHAKHTTVIDGLTYVCEKDAYFTINVIPPQIFTYNTSVIAATCNLPNGVIKLQFNNNNIVPSSYQWFTVDDVPMPGNGNEISNLPPGMYKVVVTDIYGCPSTLGPFEVKKTDLLAFGSTNNPVATADECNQKLGHIDGIAVTGGIEPYTYQWINEGTGQTVGGNTSSLAGVGKGLYKLVVTDATPCAIPLVAEHIEIGNIQYVPASPILTDKKICSPEAVKLVVQDPVEGNYNLYTDATTAVPIQTSAKGSFTVAVAESKDYYVSYNIGTCESLRTKVHVEVILVDVKFGNAFTPNDDGTNDYWKITGLEKFPGSLVQVFTRGGQKVFESKEYKNPFDGRQGGTLLPAGVYYYIINLNTPCQLLSGNVTIIR